MNTFLNVSKGSWYIFALASIFGALAVWVHLKISDIQQRVEQDEAVVAQLQQVRNMVQSMDHSLAVPADSLARKALKFNWDMLIEKYDAGTRYISWERDYAHVMQEQLRQAETAVATMDSLYRQFAVAGIDAGSQVHIDSVFQSQHQLAMIGYSAAIDQVAGSQKSTSGKMKDVWKFASVFIFGAYFLTLVTGYEYHLFYRNRAEKEVIEKALQKSEFRFEKMFNEAQVGIALVEIAERRIIEANPTFCGLVGYTAGELQHAQLEEITFPGDRAQQNKSLQDVEELRQPSCFFEQRFLTKFLREVWVSISATVIFDEAARPEYTLLIVENISARKQAEHASQRSEERYRLLAENATDIISKISTTGKITYVTPAIMHVLGYEPVELIGQRISDLVHPEDSAAVLEAGKRVAEEPMVERVRYRARRKDGEYTWVETNVQAVFDQDGMPLETVSVTRDITQRISFEDTLRRTHLRLEQRVDQRTAALKRTNQALEVENSERKRAEDRLKSALKEKDLLMQEIFHRVKNNLQVISSLLKLQSQQAEHQETIRILEDSRNRLNSMALIHANLYGQDDLSQVDFAEYVRKLSTHLLKTYQHLNVGRVDLNILFGKILLDIETAIPCGLIINELISNSLKYAFPDCPKSENVISIDFIEQVDHYHLLVSDNGVGLPADVDVFDSRSFGLKLVRMLIRQLDGEQIVNSGDGTTFKIKLAKQEYKRRV